MIWFYELNGKFLVCKNFMVLRVVNSNSIVKGIWKGFVLLKVEVFGWNVLLGRFNIRGRLLKIGCLDANRVYCVFCLGCVEEGDYLFVYR